MSLELVIKENTEVMRQLIATMQGGNTFTPPAPPQPKTDSASVKKAEQETKPAPDDTSEDFFEQARNLIMKLSTGGYRNEAVEILNKFGAQKLGQVPQEKLEEVVTLAKRALAEE